MDSKIAMLFSSFLAISCLRKAVCGDPVVPCYFIFGDSLADNGNNNNLPTLAKADYEPYGIDLPGVGPSGRFTNGLTAFDFIAQSLGFTDLILPHATASGIELLRGVNYASASSGILPGTGSNLGTHISLDDQLQNHQNVIKTIFALVGEAKAKQQLNSCLYTIGMGSNDYINGHFVKGSSASRSNPEQYASLLIDHYYSQLKALHGFGARKIALFGLGSIGCTPFAIASSGSNTCVEKMNAAVKIFNEKLHQLVDHLNSAFIDAKFMLVNITGMSTSSTDAIMELRTACCQMAQTGTCVPNSMPCPDRSAYAFFDGFHPTEVINQGVAGRAYRATSPTDTYPTDISHLVTY